MTSVTTSRGGERQGGPSSAEGDSDEGARVELLVADVLAIQRRFGHENRNLQADRRDQVREAIERVAESDA